MTHSLYGGHERRRHPRSRIPFFVTVTGTDDAGHEMDDAGILYDISESGLYIRIPQRVGPRAEIQFLLRFTQPPVDGPQIKVRGRVVRSETRTLGISNLAVEFTRPLLEGLGQHRAAPLNLPTVGATPPSMLPSFCQLSSNLSRPR